MSCGVGHRHGLDPSLLQLWCRPAAVDSISPLAWECPYALGVALKSKKQKQKQTNKNQKQKKRKRGPFWAELTHGSAGLGSGTVTAEALVTVGVRVQPQAKKLLHPMGVAKKKKKKKSHSQIKSAVELGGWARSELILSH